MRPILASMLLMLPSWVYTERIEMLEQQLLETQRQHNELLQEVGYEPIELITSKNKLTYMHYALVTDSTAPQFFYRHNGYTGDLGIRKHGEYYQVAMGYKYANIGDKFEVTFDTGLTIKVIVADSKGDRYAHDDGSQIEFLVDERLIPRDVKLYGDFNRHFGNHVVEIKKIKPRFEKFMGWSSAFNKQKTFSETT